jgi:hypothetical protein
MSLTIDRVNAALAAAGFRPVATAQNAAIPGRNVYSALLEVLDALKRTRPTP